MRMLLIACLLSGSVLADSLVEVAHVRLRAQPTAVGALKVGRGYAPLLVFDQGGRASAVAYGLDGRPRFTAVVDGEALGIASTRAASQLCSRHATHLAITDLRFTGGALRATETGRINWNGLRRPRILRTGTRNGRPVLICAHEDGISALASARGAGGSPIDIDASTRRYVATTDFFDCDKDRLEDLFALDATGAVIHLEEQTRGGPYRAEEYRYDGDGMTPVALLGDGDRLWVIGNRGGTVVMARYDANQKAGGGEIRKLKDIFKQLNKPSRAAPQERVDLGAGTVTSVDRSEGLLILRGTNGRRPWLYVRDTRTGRGAAAAIDAGSRITSVCVNPARYGWSLAAVTDNREMHVLRFGADRAAPGGWNPYPDAGPAAQPIPTPVEPPAEDAPPVAQGLYAYFPRVAADTRVGIDTKLYLVYLGARPVRLSVHFFDDAGTRIASTTLALRRGQRGEVALGTLLEAQRLLELDGYAVVTGASRADLVAEGVTTRGAAMRRGGGGGGTTLRPTWR